MESHYPHEMEGHSTQIQLIHNAAKKIGVAPDQIAPAWIEEFSPRFRTMWESGVRDIGAFESELYGIDGTINHHEEMVNQILVTGKRIK